MARARRWILLMVLALAAGPRLWAASSAESRAFDAAKQAFDDHIWDRAQDEFAQFRQIYTNSARLPEAILFQAQARFEKSNYDGAIALLSANVDLAGNWADQYLFFLGEAQFKKRELRTAADTFARLVRTYPMSARRLEALVREATVLEQLGGADDWRQAIELLQATNGLFQAVARTNTANEFVRRGYLLLGEALLAQTNYTAAETALHPLQGLRLPPELEWQDRYLLSRIQLAQQRPETALQNATNLLALAEATRQPALKARSAALLGSIYEALGRGNEAIAAYQLNLPEGTPAEMQREALLKMTRLYLNQNRIAEAAQKLQQFLEQNPAAPSADVALLQLGELRLRLASASAGNGPNTPGTLQTNYLPLALTALESLTNRFPQSPLFGKAQLALGWCFWLSNALPQSQAAFQLAVQRLGPPTDAAAAYDLAVAHFKLGDTLYQQTKYAAAISDYAAVVDRFGAWSEVRTQLCEAALYQIVRAGLAADDLSAASNALGRILVDFPNGFYADRAVLLTGQTVGEQDPAAARQLFLDFARRATNAALLPELQMAIARTYELERKWDEAIAQYGRVLNTVSTNAAQFAQAMYFQAVARWRAAGYNTNTLAELTSFVDRYPAHPFAPQARWWIADYYDSIGRLDAAEANFELIFQNTNWAGRDIAYRAQMEAGRVAFKRTSWDDAHKYFGGLAGNASCPPELRAQAFFALGSTLMASTESTNKTVYQQALNAFDQAALQAPDKPIAIQALGEKANCFLQLRDYLSASNYYQMILTTNRADVSARCAASVGLGLVLERLADQQSGAARSNLLFEASNRYLDVFYPEKILRDGEHPDDFWTMKAGQEAARLLAGPLKQRDAAIQIYQRLQAAYPSLRLTETINRLRSETAAEPPSKSS